VHVFLQGPKNIGKTTVILKTIELLRKNKPIAIGGFFTWKGGNNDRHIYIQSAGLAAPALTTQTKNSLSSYEKEIFRLATWDSEQGKLVSNIESFEEIGVHILAQSKGVDLIIMDELGNLESNARLFKKAVLDTLSGTVPVLGALRMGDIPWHNDIKQNLQVTLHEVNEKNREALPQVIAGQL